MTPLIAATAASPTAGASSTATGTTSAAGTIAAWTIAAGTGGAHPVARIRSALGLTQHEFATVLGLSAVSVSRWEHRHMAPTGLSQLLLELLLRALSRNHVDVVLRTLRPLALAHDLERVVALVHLGDAPSTAAQATAQPSCA